MHFLLGLDLILFWGYKVTSALQWYSEPVETGR